MVSVFSSWLFSILSISIIEVLSELVLPNGKMRGIVKTVIAIIGILLIINPVKNFDFTNLNFNFSNFEINEEFVDKNSNSKIDSLTYDIENSLKNSGFNGVKISLNADEKYLIKTIYVDLSRLVLNESGLNINKYTNIVAIIKQFVNIDEGNIIFYEWRKQNKFFKIIY